MNNAHVDPIQWLLQILRFGGFPLPPVAEAEQMAVPNQVAVPNPFINLQGVLPIPIPLPPPAEPNPPHLVGHQTTEDSDNLAGEDQRRIRQIQDALKAPNHRGMSMRWRRLSQHAITAKHEAAESTRAAALAEQEGQPEEVQLNLSLLAREATERADRAAQDKDRFEEELISAHQAAAAQRPRLHQQQPVWPFQLQAPVNLLLQMAQHPSSSTAQNGGAQVAHGTPAVAGGGPIRLASRGGARRRPSKLQIMRQGKMIGKGYCFDPITGNYTRFSCTIDACPYTTGNRQNVSHHFKRHHKE